LAKTEPKREKDKELETPPSAMPSGWASVLYLFNLR
jgi:hypothetical protein